MIRSDAEYKKALKDLDLVLALTEEEKTYWSGEGMTEEETSAMVAPLRLRAAELRDRIQLFERVRAGDLSMFTTLDHLGEALIAARVARGLNQRELADLIGVHESQVSRDERSEYHGVGGERLRDLMKALDLTFKGRFSLSSRGWHSEEPKPGTPLRGVGRAERR